MKFQGVTCRTAEFMIISFEKWCDCIPQKISGIIIIIMVKCESHLMEPDCYIVIIHCTCTVKPAFVDTLK